MSDVGYSWQYQLETVFSAPLPPDTVQRRETYQHEGDMGVTSPDQNMTLRMRDYDDDGHGERQEAVLASGTRTGQLLRGNDNSLDKSVHLTYADVVLAVSDYFSVKTADVHNFLWNSTPFNPRLNPYFQMPAALRTVEDAFEYAQGSVPGLSDLSSIASLLPSLNMTSPFDVYTNMTPQLIPLMNKFALEALRLLLPYGDPTVNIGSVPTPHAVSPIPPAFMPVGWPIIPPGQPVPSGTPLQYSPEFIALAAFAQIDTATGFETSIEAGQLGQYTQQLLLSTVPGVGPVLGAFA